MKIKRLYFNWHQGDMCDEFCLYEVGENVCYPEKKGKVVKEIREHQAQGEGDKWYYDVIFEDGEIRRVFNPNEVIFVPEEEE